MFRIEDRQLLYTLHGHYGPITCLFIDQVNPNMAASGSQDGMLCVWDLITGLSLMNHVFPKLVHLYISLTPSIFSITERYVHVHCSKS